jgi:hypothetical protein
VDEVVVIHQTARQDEQARIAWAMRSRKRVSPRRASGAAQVHLDHGGQLLCLERPRRDEPGGNIRHGSFQTRYLECKSGRPHTARTDPDHAVPQCRPKDDSCLAGSG